MRRIALASAGAALLLVLAGCSGTPDALPPTAPAVEQPSAEPTEAPEAPLAVGVPFTLTQAEGVAQVTIKGASYGDHPSDIWTASNGGILILDVEWETTEGVTAVNSLYFEAKDSAGGSSSVALGIDNKLGSTKLPAGEKVRGNVGLDIADASPYVVTLSDTLLNESARITVEPTRR